MRFATLGELKAAVLKDVIAELAKRWGLSEEYLSESLGPLFVPSTETDAEHEIRAAWENARVAIRQLVKVATAYGLPDDEQAPARVPGIGVVGNQMRWWVAGFMASPLSRGLFRVWSPVAPLLSNTRKLTNFVRRMERADESVLGLRTDDRELALMALRAGWWPDRMTSPVEKTTVAMVVSSARHAVTQLRKGK